MKIFITGIAGFVASNLANRLHDIGYLVYGVDNLKFGNANNLNKNINWDVMDMIDIPTDVINSYDILVHMACDNIRYAQNFPIETFKTNSLKSIQIINKFKKKVIYTSTTSVYGQADILPTPESATIKLRNAYDQSKYITELFLNKRKNYTTLRLSNVYGVNQRIDNPYQAVIPKFIHQTINGNSITIYGDGNDTRDFTYIDDVVNALLIAINKKSINCAINIGTSVETSVNNICDILHKQLNVDIRKEYISAQQVDGISRRSIDFSLAKIKLGWNPNTDIYTGVKKTIEWVNKNYN